MNQTKGEKTKDNASGYSMTQQCTRKEDLECAMNVMRRERQVGTE